MPEPQRKISARKPTVVKMRKYLVRLWEIERKKGAVPSQIRGFEIEADAIHRAQKAVRKELEDTHRRVIRSCSMQTDGVFVAVVFKNEVRTEEPKRVSEFPLRRDFDGERASIAASHATRRAKAREAEKARVIDLAAARASAKKERRAKIAESRKKQAERKRQEQELRRVEAIEQRAERQAARDKARGRIPKEEG